MNTTFEIGMTVAMLALWALAVVTTMEHQAPVMKARPVVEAVAVAEPAASDVALRER